MTRPTRETDADQALDRLISGTVYGWGRGAALGQFTYLRAHSACTSVADIDSIDWSMWRLGIEYSDLARRAEARGKAIHIEAGASTTVSQYLRCAIGHALFGARPAAKTLLSDLASPLVESLNSIQMGGKIPVRAGAIGFAFREILGHVPSHPALVIEQDLVTGSGLARAVADRKTYANPKNEGGSLLNSPEGDLIPLELILLNRSLPIDQQDPVLNHFASKIAATNFPDDPIFQAMETKISVEGW